MGGIADSLSLMKSEVYEFVNQFEEHKHKVVMVSRGGTRPRGFHTSHSIQTWPLTFENTHWNDNLMVFRVTQGCGQKFASV